MTRVLWAYANNRAIHVSANCLRVIVYRYTTEHRQRMCCLLPEIDGLQAPMACTTRTYRVDIITNNIDDLQLSGPCTRRVCECLLTGLGFVSNVTVYRVIRPPYTVYKCRDHRYNCIRIVAIWTCN